MNKCCFEQIHNEARKKVEKDYYEFTKPKNEKNKRGHIPAKMRINLLNKSARFVEKENKYIPSCSFCGKTAKESTLHIDHIIPVSKGGATTEDNLQVLCSECNLQKNNKYDLIINN
ncbi:HNH endonuclease [Heyndrickxia camelliae]|uniref:HNH endonuclease n=1 Tax=Heyndrickxia camelliae TaxID=1707093 RepID=UPI001A9C83F5|nr:HNH endonuclease [Heyndrickxia camelliae]